MGKNNQKNKKAAAAAMAAPLSKSKAALKFALAIGLVTAGLAAWRQYGSRPETVNVSNPTFARDVAPLLYRNCAVCHHPGGPAPFELISYADAAKRAPQIVNVTQSRTMPPWLPEHGYGDFEGERRLSDDEILLLKNWVAQGAPQGPVAQTPEPPQFTSGWQLGPPDLVVQMPRVYTLPADGRDVYRNFVMPIPLAQDRFVKGMEFRAGSKRIHHAFIFIDPTPGSREKDGKESQPGWAGMSALAASAQSPSGQFTSWQPGRIARLHEDMAWKLSPGTDLVLQMHMQPGGKPEPVQPSVAFYFTDKPGTIHPSIALLRGLDFDIPAGGKAYPVRSSYTLPVDTDVLGVLPHVHYLGKDLRAYATLPDGSRTWLLWIKNWDFNWQSDFAFKRPVTLPAGTKVEMEYSFDNSADNPFNPNHPPKPVRYGLQSTDEMAELWLQILPHKPADAASLNENLSRAGWDDVIARNEVLLKQHPTDPAAHLKLGKALLQQGKSAAAESHLRTAVRLADSSSQAHYYLGYFLNSRIQDPQMLRECLNEFSRAIQLDPKNFEAYNGLGHTLLQAGKFKEAEGVLLAGLRIKPGDPVLLQNLAQARQGLGTPAP